MQLTPSHDDVLQIGLKQRIVEDAQKKVDDGVDNNDSTTLEQFIYGDVVIQDEPVNQ